MISAGSPGSTSTTAKTTTVAKTSVTRAAATRRERNSIIATQASPSCARLSLRAAHPRRRSFPMNARQVELRRRRVLPQPDQVLLPHADLGELEEVAVHGIAGDDLLRFLEQLVALGEV